METFNQVGFLKLDDESFMRLSTYVTETYGIKLPPEKKILLETRLNKKVKSLGMASYKEFVEYLFSEQGKKHELLPVIDLITTNKTDFFREAGHFQFLTQEFLPTYQKQSSRLNLKIWSAGCSTGEEPYTLVMVLEEYLKRHPACSYSLLASDISIRAIQTAYQGIYEVEKTGVIPLELKRQYFLLSKSNLNVVRVKPVYRQKISYQRINLMENVNSFPKGNFDFIFCRNVLIYFDKRTQEEVIKKFCRCLRPGGLLFLGHSESIMGMQLPLKPLKPTIYQRQ